MHEQMPAETRSASRPTRGPRLSYGIPKTVILVLTCSSLASAVTFQNVVGLGDSLLDDSAGTRSPVVAEHLADFLGTSLTNFARSGATSTDLLSQGQHTSAAAQFGSGDLAVVWIGGNDFFENSFSILFGSYGFLNTLEANVTTTVSTLRNAGLDVLLLNLPDMARIPAVQNVGLGLENFRSATLQWRSRLNQLAAGQGAAVVDVFSLFEDLNTDPSDFALLGRIPLLGPAFGCDLCVFADEIHPSSVSQGFVANDAAGLLESIYDPGGLMPLGRVSHVTLAGYVGILPGDFDEDGRYTVADVDALVGEVVAGSNGLAFDLTGNRVVDHEDLDLWRTVAGAASLPSGGAILVGDANLDGAVDGSDFGAWNASKFTQTARWSAGDFNADGLVDGSDFNLWNTQKFQTSDDASAFVPEPRSVVAIMFIVAALASRSRGPLSFLGMARHHA